MSLLSASIGLKSDTYSSFCQLSSREIYTPKWLSDTSRSKEFVDSTARSRPVAIIIKLNDSARRHAMVKMI